MKKLYFLIAMIACMATATVAQSPWSITHSRTDTPSRIVEDDRGISTAQAGISLRNLWIGSSVLWNVDENAPIESPGVIGSLLYNLYETEKFALPLWGNISLNDNGGIDNPDEGVSLGIYPSYVLQQNGTFTVLLHGGVGYRRYSDAEDIDQTEIKLLAGIEVAIGSPGGLPTTFNVSPVYRLGQGDLPNVAALEVTGIVPIGNGLGFMAEGNFPFSEDDGESLFRLGVLVNGRL